MKHPSLRLVPAFVALAVLTIPAGSAHARDNEADGPLYGAPVVGTCSTMTLHQSGRTSDVSTAVDCSQAHTAKVAGVVTLPAKVNYSDGQLALYRVVAKKCLPQVNLLLGLGSEERDSSAFLPIFFRPTYAQQQHGARWLSCSVILASGTKHGPSLAEFPNDHHPLLPAHRYSDSLARCVRDVGKRSFWTQCSGPHQWRADGSFRVARWWPGTHILNMLGAQRCAHRTHSRTYSWRYQDKVTWNLSHDHAVVCYTKTRH